MLTQGRHTAEIIEHTLKMIGDKEVCSLTCCVPGDPDEFEVIIWLTPKAMGIARRSLKLCGFDVDTQDLNDLIMKPELLNGNKIPILAEMYNGNLRAQILLSATPEKSKVSEIQAALRAAKKHGAEGDEEVPF